MAESAALVVRDRLEGRTRPSSARTVNEDDRAIMTEARSRWNKCDEAEDAQRKNILAAKKFRAGDQWPAAIKLQREGAQAIQGQAAQPPRPCLTIDRLSQPVRQVSNTIKSANFAIDVLPNGHGADDDTAEIIQGYLRRVQNQARGESPIEWAADGAIEGGIGWFRIRTEYVEEAPDPNNPDWDIIKDQELRLERIANNLTVYCDPSAMRPTRSDALFDFVTEDMDRDEFMRRWPNASVEGIEDFAATGDMKGWVSDDSIRIAEYWRIVYQDEHWIRVGNKAQQVASKPKDIPAADYRMVRRPKVEGYKINAVEILERWDWVGSRIPLIPVLGEELNVDGKPVLRGIISEGMDAQRMVNYTYSGAVEIFALGSKSPYVVEEEQLGDFAAIWQTANLYNYSYLPYKKVLDVPPPHRETSEAPIQAAVELMRVSEECVKATTGYYDSGLGANDSRIQSGRAKQSEIQQSELGSSNYPNNVQRALIYAGELMLEIMPKITRPGQILQILGKDDEPEQVMVGQRYMPGPNGQPQPVSEEQQNFEKGLVKFYDLNAGRYAVTVTVGKANATKREEGAAALGELIPHLPPEMAMVATPDYVEQLSFPGAHGIAEKLRKALPPQLQEQEEGGPDPEKAQMQQMIAQLQQALEQKRAEEEAKQQAETQRVIGRAQLEGQTKLQLAQGEAQLTLQKAQIDAQTRIEVAKINAQAGLTEAEIKAGMQGMGHQIQREEQLIGNDHELRVQAIDHQHEGEIQAQQHAQAVEQAGVQHEQALEQGEQVHGQTLEQTEQAAKLAPKPKADA